jgi:hypothetical protein
MKGNYSNPPEVYDYGAKKYNSGIYEDFKPIYNNR